jgi:hypothetical protein
MRQGQQHKAIPPTGLIDLANHASAFCSIDGRRSENPLRILAPTISIVTAQPRACQGSACFCHVTRWEISVTADMMVELMMIAAVQESQV